MKLFQTALVFIATALPLVACPRCKAALDESEAGAWFFSIVSMILAPFLFGGAAFAYIARFGRKGR